MQVSLANLGPQWPNPNFAIMVGIGCEGWELVEEASWLLRRSRVVEVCKNISA